jgi:methylated-DNA-protein-cysteine methyltransferase-like protein
MNRLYERIYEVIQQIPAGKVATYGQIADIVGECSPRMVGYALAALKPGWDVPWQRVINSQGKISLRADGTESIEQRHLLELEGIRFDNNGLIDLEKFGWLPPGMFGNKLIG